MPYQETIQKISPGGYYHIYNRGNNKETIFKEPANYIYFLNLWKKHIEPVAETFCYNLLPNHFHFFIRVREQTSQVFETCEVSERQVSQSFSNLFNAYAKAINKKYGRTGSLFQERFRRKEITDEGYYTSIILYIITNAVRHGYCLRTADYPWSAYNSLLSDKPTMLLRDEVISWFGNRDMFEKHVSNYEKQLPAAVKDLLEKDGDD